MGNSDNLAKCTTIVIFGAPGDLTRRKRIPALYNNFKKQRLPDGLRVAGVARREWSDDQVRDLLREAAQNILFLRFANTIFEPVWNRPYVANIQITVAESVDVGRRAGYYDQAGVLRDMFQNHLPQLLALVAMEPPASLSADAIRNERVKVLSAVRPIRLEDTVRAQHDGYRSVDGVPPDSRTPTLAASRSVHMSHSYSEAFPGVALPDAYERLLVDALKGDASLFARSDGIKAAFDADPGLANLLLAPYFRQVAADVQGSWRKMFQTAVGLGIPPPALATGLIYYDTYRTARLPANLLQAQRDCFGAHTYERIDKPRGEFFHTNWTGRGGATSSSNYEV
jgi:glucose-6-phosphate 1-dehydrogenase